MSSKRRAFWRVVYPRVVLRTKKYYLDASGYFTVAPGFGHVAHPPTHTVVTGNDYVAQGKSPDNWKHLLAICQSATSNHNGRLTQCKPILGTSLYTYADKSVDVISGYIDTSCYSIPDPPNGLSVNVDADNQAKARLLDSYQRIMNTWRGGNFLAEIRETIELLKHPVKAFYHRTYKFAGEVKRLGKIYRADPHRYGKELANAWLAYIFGIKPLVSDANDLSQALYKLGTSSFDRVKLYGHGHASTSTVSQISWNCTVSGHPNVGQVQDKVVKMDSDVKYKGAIKRRPLDNRLIIRQFGVGVYDIIPAVWEAIPWSFFIDYFVNVQEVLDGMRLCQADLAWLEKAWRNAQVNRTSEPRLAVQPGTTHWSCAGGGGWTLCSMHQRTALTTMPYPSFYFKFPGLTSLKWLNIAALSQQIRGSQPRLITH